MNRIKQLKSKIKAKKTIETSWLLITDEWTG